MRISKNGDQQYVYDDINFLNIDQIGNNYEELNQWITFYSPYVRQQLFC